MNKETLQQVVHDIVHEGTQIPETEDVVVLTANRIGRLTHNGTLDFGGSEYTEAPIEWIEPKKKSDDDKYAWWMLEGGDYIVEYNETVHPTSGMRCYLQIWEKAERNGLSQPMQIIRETRSPLTATFRVGTAGVEIKENARVSVVGSL